MLAVMSPIAPAVIDLITRPRKRRQHGLVCSPPAARIDIKVIASVLKEDAQWFWLCFSYQRSKHITAAQSNVRSDSTQYPPECIRSFPCCVERANCTGACTRNTPVIGISAEVVFPGHLRQDFFQQEAGVAVAGRIV